MQISRFDPGDKNQDVYRHIRTAGLAVFLPFFMAAGPIAGYLAGDWIGQNLLGGVAWTRLVGLGLGFAAGGHQSILIIRRLLRELK